MTAAIPDSLKKHSRHQLYNGLAFILYFAALMVGRGDLGQQNTLLGIWSAHPQVPFSRYAMNVGKVTEKRTWNIKLLI